MKRSECWIKSESDKRELKRLFQKIDDELSGSYFDNPVMQEGQLEGNFRSLFTQYSKRYIDRINDSRAKKGLCRLKISFNHITHNEREHGADLGLVLQVELRDEIKLKKAVLVQSKKLYPKNGKFDESCSYEQLFESGVSTEPQWKRMQEITSSSVYFFYNPDRLEIKGRIRDLDTRVLSAQSIEGKAQAKIKSVTAAQMFEEGIPFSDWIVDTFICCIIGDTKEKAIMTALGETKEFSVHNTFHFTIEEAIESEIK
jgi:hypothetical protein